ncbi:MAG: hypothetical protein WKF70_14750, partial [Chitinophagaceae bacterium]
FYFLTTTIGSLIGGVGRLVGSTLGTVGNVAGRGIEAAAPAVEDALNEQGIDLSNLKEEATKLLRQPQNLPCSLKRFPSKWMLQATKSKTALAMQAKIPNRLILKLAA